MMTTTMTLMLVGYVLAVIAALAASARRGAFIAISAQFVFAGLVLTGSAGIASATILIQAADLFLFRGVLLPVLFLSLLKKGVFRFADAWVPTRPLISAIALGVCVVSYGFGSKIFPDSALESVHLAAATVGVVTGILILAIKESIVSQLTGFLTMESGMILTEAMSPLHEHWLIQLLISVAFGWSIFTFLNFFRQFSGDETVGEVKVL